MHGERAGLMFQGGLWWANILRPLRKSKSSSELCNQTEKMISVAPYGKHPGSRKHKKTSSENVFLFRSAFSNTLHQSLHKKTLEVNWFCVFAYAQVFQYCSFYIVLKKGSVD